MTLARPVLHRLLVLLPLLWLVPGTGLAAPRRSPLLDAPPTRAQRLLAEVGLGLLGGAAGGALGYFVLGPRIPCAAPGRLCEEVVLSTAIGAGFGMAAGVYAGGQLLQGEGDFLFGPALGMALGFVGGALLAQPLGDTAALLTCPPLMLLGALAGYELSAKGPSASARIQPLVSLSPRGARVGLAGSF
ncbi:MAG TPA: hypothetical protein VF664_02040 [Cystobacter sp.]